MLYNLDSVNYAYPDGTPALIDVTLKIESGQRWAILGANGSGKSTLLRLLAGLIYTDSGTLSFNGQVIEEQSLQRAEVRIPFRQSLGFVFQNADAQLFNATVEEEIAFGPRQLGLPNDVVDQRVCDVMNYLRISHLGDRPPFRLSGGEKRKVAIGSVLSMNPSVLIFDEPFLGLDARSQGWLIRTLGELNRVGKTTIISTHTIDLLPRVADYGVVLSEEHRIVGIGTIQELLADEQLLSLANLVE